MPEDRKQCLQCFDTERVPPKETLPGKVAFISNGYKETLSNIKEIMECNSMSPCWNKNILKTKASQLRDQSD